MIAFFLLLIFVIIAFKDLNKATWSLIFFILVIPTGEIIPGFNTATILRIGSVSVFEIILVFYLFLFCITGKLKAKRYQLLPFVLMFIYGIYLLFSISKYGINNCLADAKDYFVSLLLIPLVLQITDRYSFDDFCDMVLKSSLCSSIIILSGYILTFHTFLPSASRYGFSIQAVYIFTIPYSLYCIFIKEKYNRWMVAEVILQLYLFAISKNRTNPIIIILILLFMVTYYIFFDKNNKTKSKIRLGIAAFVIGVLLLLFYVLIQNRVVPIDFLGRFSEMFNEKYTVESMKIRENNINYYINKIIEAPLGVGFGAYMPVLSLYKDGFDDTTLLNYGFDNAFITIAYKAGIICSILYFIFLVESIFWAFQRRKKNHVFFLCFLILVGLVISGSLLTVQLIKNISVYTFFISFLVFMRNRGNGKL